MNKERVAIIELITEGPPGPSMMFPECDLVNLPTCVQHVRFRVERNFLAPEKPTEFVARIAVSESGQSFVAEIRGDTFRRLKSKLRKFFGKISVFKRERHREAAFV